MARVVFSPFRLLGSFDTPSLFDRMTEMGPVFSGDRCLG
jgi:hypothetical protein